MAIDIVTRAEWGAQPARSRRVIDTPTPRLWIHHTAGALDQNGNGVWWDDVRSIQDFHMRPVSRGGRGWDDIAYSFVVGGGQVYEGRGVGIAGGHTRGDNSKSHAICLIGNYDFMHPTPEDLRAIADLARHGREQGWWGEITGGHRSAPGASTACPGGYLQAALPELRALAASKPAPQPSDEEDETMFLARKKGDPAVYLFSAGRYEHMRTRADSDAIAKAAGISPTEAEVSADQWGVLTKGRSGVT